MTAQVRGSVDARSEDAFRHVAPVPRLSLEILEACDALGVSHTTWREHIEPDIRLVRLGRKKLVPVAELERWLSENAQKTLEHR